MGRGDLHGHRLPGGRAGDHRPEVPGTAAHLPAHTRGRRRRRSAAGDRVVLRRRGAVRAAARRAGDRRGHRRGPAAAGRSGRGVLGVGVRVVAGLVHGRCAPHAGRCCGGPPHPGVHPGTPAGRGGRRGDPRLPAVPELELRAGRDPQSARIDLDQRAAADRVRAVCLVRRAAVVRVGQRGCAPRPATR